MRVGFKGDLDKAILSLEGKHVSSRDAGNKLTTGVAFQVVYTTP
jgi:hypothetical protein